MSGCLGAATGGGRFEESKTSSFSSEEEFKSDSESNAIEFTRLEKEIQEIFKSLQKVHTQKEEALLLDKLLEIRSLDLFQDQIDKLNTIFETSLYKFIDKRISAFKTIKKLYQNLRNSIPIDPKKLEDAITYLDSCGIIPAEMKGKITEYLICDKKKTSDGIKLTSNLVKMMQNNPDYLGSILCIAATIKASSSSSLKGRVKPLESKSPILPGVKKIQLAVRDFFDSSKKRTILGDGSFGEVQEVDEATVVKVRKIKLEIKDIETDLELIFNNFSKIKDSDSIAPIFAVYYHLFKKSLALFSKKAKGEDALTTLSKRTKPFNASEVLEIGSKICKGIRILHESGVAHCDIKMENFMLNGLDVCIIDFDEATEFGKSPRVFSYGYTIFEDDEPASIQHDYFSIGACLFELYTKKSLTSFLNIEKTSMPSVLKYHLMVKKSNLQEFLESEFPKTKQQTFLNTIILDLLSIESPLRERAFNQLQSLTTEC